MDIDEHTLLSSATGIVNEAGTGLTWQQRNYFIEAIVGIQRKRALLRQELLRVYREPYSPRIVRQRIEKALVKDDENE